jgi:hypothetical protein
MRRTTRVIVLAVDEDPLPGAFDKTRIVGDITRILEQAIPHYNPKVQGIDSFVRDSNFVRDVTVSYEVPSSTLTFEYPAEREA